MSADGRVTVYTIGHSNRSTDELAALLAAHRIGALVDVRRYPTSRWPQFRRDALAKALAARGVDYAHEERLGGHRESSEDSPHVALEATFRGYADHLATAVFRRAALDQLARAARERIVVMCAEREPERCHRKLLADFLVARGARVVHVVGPGEAREHELDPRVLVRSPDVLVYARSGDEQLELFRG